MIFHCSSCCSLCLPPFRSCELVQRQGTRQAKPGISGQCQRLSLQQMSLLVRCSFPIPKRKRSVVDWSLVCGCQPICRVSPRSSSFLSSNSFNHACSSTIRSTTASTLLTHISSCFLVSFFFSFSSSRLPSPPCNQTSHQCSPHLPTQTLFVACSSSKSPHSSKHQPSSQKPTTCCTRPLTVRQAMLVHCPNVC